MKSANDRAEIRENFTLLTGPTDPLPLPASETVLDVCLLRNRAKYNSCSLEDIQKHTFWTTKCDSGLKAH
jgi:hypothetical protein